MKLIVGILLLFFPGTIFAAASDVRINELAWMGTIVSGTDEWIELYNSGNESADLSGWSIVSDDGSPTILLSGSIAPLGYFLIERTDDESVPGITADLIVPFGNGLSNSGEILRLLDGSGATVDIVDGSGDWQSIGGDNALKHTPQRSSNGWITGEPTPRARNIDAGVTDNSNSGDTASTTTATTTSTSSPVAPNPTTRAIPGPYPRKYLTVTSGEDMRVYVGMETKFSGNVLGFYDEELPYATLHWNFGDGTVASGRKVSHVYRYPGEYAVVLSAINAGIEASDRMVVSVRDPEVSVRSVTSGTSGYIEIQSLSAKDLDISGWTIRDANGGYFVYPRGTTILPGKTVKFAQKDIGLSAGDIHEVTLLFPNNEAAWGNVFVAPETPKETNTTVKEINSPLSRKSSATAAPMIAASNETVTLPRIDPIEEGISEQQATVLWARDAHVPDTDREGVVLLGGALLLVVVAGGLLYRSHIGDPTEADEYTIMEDIIEGKDDRNLG